MSQKCVTKVDLDSLIGRLDHTAMMMPYSSNFIGRLRRLVSSTTHKNKRLCLSGSIIRDLQLQQFFLKQTNDGIDMNILVES